MKTIIIDTNFLVDCLAWKVDFFREITRILPTQYALKVVDTTLHELDHVIMEGKTASKLGAKLAKQLIAQKRIGIIPTIGGHTDALILHIATKDMVVATQDQAFKRKLKEKGIPIIIIRQKKYLEFTGH